VKKVWNARSKYSSLNKVWKNFRLYRVTVGSLDSPNNHRSGWFATNRKNPTLDNGNPKWSNRKARIKDVIILYRSHIQIVLPLSFTAPAVVLAASTNCPNRKMNSFVSAQVRKRMRASQIKNQREKYGSWSVSEPHQRPGSKPLWLTRKCPDLTDKTSKFWTTVHATSRH
jgi:hypothetical protein